MGSTNEEVINITNAIAGQTYILLVTNYKDDIQNMTLSKASGDADTDCSSYLRSLNTDAPSESPSNSPIDSTETPTSFPTETETETPTSFPTETERLPAPDHVVNGECTEMLPLCASETYKYTVYSGYDITDLEAKNFYGCMRSQPNPSWFYFEIETGGDLILDLKANEDIDYVVWGPYDSVVDAIALCNGGIEESSLIDCGFTQTNEEVINITNAIAGQTYILLVTNYKDDIQNMTLSKASGDADTDCTSYLRSLNTDAPSESPSNSPIDSPSESPSNSAIDSLAPSETPSEYPTLSLSFTNSPSSSPTCAKTVNTGCDIDSDCACLKKCT